ncbi:MAG: sulfatase [Planctomycetes bacterium]|nr:sulfatase [Planctomycetota bacterium]
MLVLFVDDLGWRDVGAYGQDIAKTPNIDRLAREGMRFTQAYAANPVCSPTRAALMTGKYPARVDINDWIPGTPFPQARMLPPSDLDQLPLAETTLAERLRDRGYATWNVGKWHLGGEGFLPQDQGFAENHMGSHTGHPASHHFPFGHDAHGKPAHTHAVPGLPSGVGPGDYLADVQAEVAARLIRGARNGAQPFYLQLSFFAVHTPIEAKAADVERQRTARRDRLAALPPDARAAHEDARPRPAFAAMLENLDSAVGTVLAALDAAGLANDTLVVFTSDNGGLDSVSNNRPLRGGKRSLWEGGIRVPLLVRWPGVVAPASTCDLPVITQDVHRGVCAATEAPVDDAVVADAFDLLPAWRGEVVATRPPLFWHFPQHETQEVGPRGAMRDGTWKAIEDFATGAVLLFDLARDPGETTDLAAAEPARAAAMQAAMQTWRQRVGAAMPTKNPAYITR